MKRRVKKTPVWQKVLLGFGILLAVIGFFAVSVAIIGLLGFVGDNLLEGAGLHRAGFQNWFWFIVLFGIFVKGLVTVEVTTK